MLPAIEREWRQEEPFFRTLPGFLSGDTLYFGGGTPSCCPARAFEPLIRLFYACRQTGTRPPEITIEANPDDLSPAYARELLQIGFNRLSLGIQSFFDTHLKIMNRRHNAAQAIEAVKSAQKAGFSNLSIDLIFGYPQLSLSQWESNIKTALSLHVPHISAYQLSYETHSAWDRLLQKQALAPLSQESCARQYRLLQDLLQQAGYLQYEISNFALPGFASKHNTAYWNGIPYLGLGPGAHSYTARERWQNKNDIGTYLRGVQNRRIPRIKEKLSLANRYNEFVMLALRQTRGLDLNRLEQNFGSALKGYFIKQAEPARKGKHLIQEGATVKIPPEHLFISDAIIQNLFTDTAPSG